MEPATSRHFYFHGKEGLADEKQNCHWCQLRSFSSHSAHPINVVNTIDDEILPSNFRFIDERVLGPGVQRADESFRSGCVCSADHDCQYGDCLCLADLDEDAASLGDDESEPELDAHGRTKAYAYHSRGWKAGVLRSSLHKSKDPIYECHQGCACSSDCPNRVVERGRTIPLEIFRTKTRGWGVRSSQAIRKGQFVDRYLGEVITSAEADQRRAASAVSQHKDVYLFALDKFTDLKSLDPRLRGSPLEVDGEFMSGPTRFINHSCDPNLRIFARVGDYADKHLHDLALFAIRDIARGEELTFDYVDGNAEEGEEPDGDIRDMTRCLCSSNNCRMYLW
jgi:histone-lysine N-methyltransferase SUV39H